MSEQPLYDGLNNAWLALQALGPETSPDVQHVHCKQLCIWMDAMGRYLEEEEGEIPGEWSALLQNCVYWFSGLHFNVSMYLLPEPRSFVVLLEQDLERLAAAKAGS